MARAACSGLKSVWDGGFCVWGCSSWQDGVSTGVSILVQVASTQALQLLNKACSIVVMICPGQVTNLGSGRGCWLMAGARPPRLMAATGDKLPTSSVAEGRALQSPLEAPTTAL